ncbi:MAG: hypothetical protein QW736_06995 [Fervidicoccaceae archaeon]
MILEALLLSDRELEILIELSAESKAEFMKTSTSTAPMNENAANKNF